MFIVQLLMDHLLIVIGVIAFLLGTFPIIHHLIFGLRERKREIMCLFDDAAIGRYFDQFYYAHATEMRNNPRTELALLYDRRFGKRSFILPALIYVAALGLAIVLIGAVAGVRFTEKPLVPLIDPSAAYALAGAYLWVVLDLIGRYRQRNLVPSALYFSAFRIMISVPLATAIGVMMKAEFAAPAAFLLGAFPTNTLLLVARRTVGQRLGLGNQAEPDKAPEIEVLQGVNRPIAETFSDIGVTTLVQLAYDDPIQLAMRTNLSFNFVLDIVSQALVAIYLDPKIACRYSVRGCVEAAALFDGFKHKNTYAKQVVSDLAVELKLSIATVIIILDQIQDDPCSKFINAIWNRTPVQPVASGGRRRRTTEQRPQLSRMASRVGARRSSARKRGKKRL